MNLEQAHYYILFIKKTFTNPHFMLKFVKVLLIHDFMTVHLMDGHNSIF